MSWALKVFVPLSNASRAVIVIEHPLGCSIAPSRRKHDHCRSDRHVSRQTTEALSNNRERVKRLGAPLSLRHAMVEEDRAPVASEEAPGAPLASARPQQAPDLAATPSIARPASPAQAPATISVSP